MILCILLLLCSCGADAPCDIAATTLPVFEFTNRLCSGTGLQVRQVITQSVSCLHNYTLQVEQMRLLQKAKLTVISGAGLEDFLGDALSGNRQIVDASANMALQEHSNDHTPHEGHVHTEDPHIWLSPENAKQMCRNICNGLTRHYPQHADLFSQNLQDLFGDLDALQAYGDRQLSDLKHRELITFHDGFSYFAESFDLHILKAVEEESGAEASAAELIEIARLVRSHQLPAIFTEKNGADAAAGIISAETGADIFTLDMAISAESYFDAMYHNINTIREALQ